jgi:hypothetical protein
MYGLDSIRRFQEGGVTDALVRQYLDSRPGISESQIAQVMRETGVSPEQVARVTGADPGYVSQRYNQYLDLVDKSTVRPFSGPPSPAVSPVVSNSISLTPAGIAALAPSANVSSPANVFSPADYGPPSPIFDPAAEIQRMQAQRIEAERLRQIDLERPIVDPKDVYKTGINTTGVVNQQTDAERPIVDPNVEEFNRLIRTGDPANWQKAGELATSSGFTPEQVLTYLNDPNIFPEFGGNVTLDTVKSFVPKPPAATVVKSFDEQLNELANQNFGRSLTSAEMDTYRTEYDGELNDANINDFLKRSQKEIDQVKTARDIATKATDTAAANAEGRPGPDQIFGIPRFERQTQSNVPFAPLRRGLAQLRPAMYMPGLTSGQAPLGGSGFTPEALRTANQGLSPADRAYLMDVGGVSPAEASAAIGTPVGQLQAEYNQLRPGGLFSTGAPASRGLPEDFALQTGAYGAPTPTFFTPAPAKTTSLSESSSANANQPGSISGDGSGDSAGPDPGGFSTSVDDGPASVSTRAGGLIRMAEGGGPPKMTELSAKEAGSTFDISKYIDDEGRLVGGILKAYS